MKSLLLLAVFILSSAPLFGQSAQQLTTEGQRAYLANDVETARTKFEGALAIDPANTTAIGYMRMIKAQQAKAGGAAGGGIEKQLRSLILAEVKFKDASFAVALEYLKQSAAKQSVAVSFVIQPDVNRDTPVTLNLTDVPFLEALRYVCELGGVKYSIEKFAIVVKRP